MQIQGLDDLDDDIIKCELVSKNGQRFACTRKQLGKGSYSKVYKGYYIDNNSSSLETERKYVAIKKMRNLQLKAHECLENEIDIMKKLDHPNILKLIDVIEQEENGENIMYIVLEYCGGGDLKKLVTDKHEKKKLKEKYAIYYFKQIAEGLQYLRTHNIVHRDIKLHNILLSQDRRTLKIADFGFAKIIDNEMLVETLCGTPLYMAPEILQKKPYTNKADLWSVGVMLYEVLCGSHPFSSIESIFDLVHKINQDTIQFPNFLSWPCKDLLKRLLTKNPKERIEWDDFFNHKWLNYNFGAQTNPQTNQQSNQQTNQSLSISQNNSLLLNTSQPITLQNNQSLLQQQNNQITEFTPPNIIPIRNPIINNYSNNNIIAQSPPSFMNSPIIRELKIIDNYVHPDRVRSTPVLAFANPIPSNTSNNSNNSSLSSLSQHLSDYVGTSIKMLKDSFKTQTYNSVP